LSFPELILLKVNENVSDEKKGKRVVARGDSSGIQREIIISENMNESLNQYLILNFESF